MSGAYAHLTVVHRLDRVRLDAIEGFPAAAKDALLSHRKFAELGAVSPDYPYLALGNQEARKWADVMHWYETGRLIRAGVARLRGLDGAAFRKGLAWLLGYAAHVATDVTVHPSIALLVGGVTGHDQEHRIAEMHQDAYIFQTLHVGAIEACDFLRSGIGSCNAARGGLDDDVRSLWTGMLADVHGVEYAANPPDPDLWHGRYRALVEVAGGRGLVPLARHVGVDLGLVYPTNPDPAWLERLPVPGGGRLGYDELFEAVLGNVARTWTWIARAAVEGRTDELVALGGWNLDTGRDDFEEMVFWRTA